MFYTSHFFKLLLLNKKYTTIVPPYTFSRFSTTIKSPNNTYKSSSFTVNYLINSCGLSSQQAKFAFKKLKFNNPKKPDSVIELLKKHDFNNFQISRIVTQRPLILMYDSKKTLLSKLEFFNSIGFSKKDLANLVSTNPNILERSLKNYILPFYKSLTTVVTSDKKIITFFKTDLFFYFKHFLPNITFLKKVGVSKTNIEYLTVYFPRTVLQKHERFLEAVEKAKEMKFDPMKSSFVVAIRVFSGKSNKIIWLRSFEAYKKWGLSDDDILSVFKKQPQCMILSSDKIDKVMGFFVNEMYYESNMITAFPTSLLYDVDRRIRPRCSVIRVLSSMGMLKKTLSLSAILAPVEETFLERFVTKYEDELPHLMSAYIRKDQLLS